MLQEQAVGQVGRGRAERRTPGQVAQTGVGFSLTGIVVEVGHQADTQGVSAVQTLDYTQVAGCLCQTLPETQTTVVHRQGMGIKVTLWKIRGLKESLSQPIRSALITSRITFKSVFELLQ